MYRSLWSYAHINPVILGLGNPQLVGGVAQMTHKLTWNELAQYYDATHSGRPARTIPMERVFEWAEQNPSFEVDQDGYIYKVVTK